ncbi:MAG: phosphoribosylglycinamide formyltransferase [Bacteroidetes bacterium]|nr:phosphoribosylglycinamide formyltransferase [Bacteroidota bacterium]
MNIAVFASGRGSNFQSILHACTTGFIPARVSVLISNRADAGAHELARRAGVPSFHISRQQYANESQYIQSLLTVLREHESNVIALAGYVKKVPIEIIAQYRNKILNIHPALLPLFGGPGMYGRHVHNAVLASGMKVSGATVHFVDEEYDHGPILLQQCVPVERGDTPDTLAARVLNVEHTIYPKALKALVENRVVFDGTKAWIVE